jgi:two-component system nitrogen regulation sensor histidine kinase GlnL
MSPLPPGIHALAEDMPYAVWLLTGERAEIIWANTAAEQWLGRSNRAQQSQNLPDILTLPPDAMLSYERCRESQNPVIIRHCRIELHDGRHGAPLYHMSFFPCQNGIGLQVQTAAIPKNENTANLDAMSAMGRILAHEIKNPLAGISGAVQLLRPDVNGDEAVSLLDLIGGEIDRIRRLVDRMETLGEQDPANTAYVNIHEVLRRAARVMSTEKGRTIKFTEHYDPSLPPIMVDEDVMMQAILNLIKNSVEAIELSGQGGEIILSTLFRAGVRRRLNGGELSESLPIEIRIIDDGPGLPDVIRDQIFQPFISNKPAGQGLGLAVVSKIISGHGGIIEVKSRPGETIFSILLPLSDEVVS